MARIKEERKEVEAARDGLIRKAYNAQAKAAQRRAQGSKQNTHCNFRLQLGKPARVQTKN